MLKNAATIEIMEEKNKTVVFLSGEIDHHNAVFLRMGLDKLIEEKHPKKMILDLSSIRFMDSSGLGLLMGRFSLLRNLGGELSIRNPSESILRICRLAGLERIIKIEQGGEKSDKR